MLTEFLEINVFAFMMVFARLGSALMFLPGFAGSFISARIRLLLALAITFVCLPVLGAFIPPLPADMGSLLLLLFNEITIGVYFGVLVQGLMVALNLAGTFIGMQAGLTNSFIFDPVTAQQSALLTGFLANMAIVLIFATDVHHLMLQAVIQSYDLFRPGAPLPFGDFSQTIVDGLGNSFVLAMKLSAPIFVFGLVFYAGLGLIAKLMPQMPVFFVALPVQLFVGLGLLMITLPPVMIYFLRYLSDGLSPFLPYK